ncbi:MAG: hypothetical protein JO250_15295 [Armatimonadetes bacterium]|nr:hypothetical protein [Armatimonadota bacterium]
MRVRISPKSFQRGVRHVRQWGGRYNAADKTWEISDDRPEIGDLLSYGLIPLDDEQAVLDRRRAQGPGTGN